MSRAQDAARAVIEPVVVAAGYDLEDLTVMAAGRRRLVKVMIDRDGGVTLDDAAAMSRGISAAMDADDPMGAAPYVLEVTSPGVDRPLTLPRHWRRNVGRLVTVTLPDEVITGRIGATTDTDVTLDLGDEGQRVIAQNQVAKAVVQVELNRKAPAVADDLTSIEPDTDN